MKPIAIVSLLSLALFGWTNVMACAESLDVSVAPLTGGEPVHLCEAYADKVVLVVNTASKCGFTPQYATLEKLYDDYREQGLEVLGFPSNDFGNQEPGSSSEIKEFCRMTYGVQFPMFAKSHAREDVADPIYQRLGKLSGEFPRWNFHKYLIDRDGNVVGSFRSQVSPDSLRPTIEKLLSGSSQQG